MIERQKSFLVEILGDMGSNALFKSLDKSELITQALLPRAIFSWVKGVGEFDGIIPGGEELISFTKSEKGFSGKIGDYQFADESLIHVAAVLAATMGTEKGFNAGTKSSDLEKLGKSVDLLVRSKLVQEGLSKAELEKANLTPEQVGQRGGEVSQRAVNATKLANKTNEYGDHSAAVKYHKLAAHHHDKNPLLATSHKNAMSYHSNKMMEEHHYTGGLPTKKNDELEKSIFSAESTAAHKASATAKTSPSYETHHAASIAHEKAMNATSDKEIGKTHMNAKMHHDKQKHQAMLKNDELEKAGMEPPVKNAAPVAPTAPVAAGQTPAVKPAAPAAVATAPKMPKTKTATPKPAGATVALTRSEMNFKCPACADSQFKDDEFVGCICFQVLNKSIDMLALDELGCVIHISEDFDTIKTLMEAMGRE